MPISVKPLATRLQLRLNTGLDEDFNPIYRTRSYSNIKTDAVNADLFDLAQDLESLQVHSVNSVRRVDEVELEEV